MPHGRRQFAKNSSDVRHFRLVARSQKDKEGDNPDATPLVLEPFVPTKNLAKKIDEAELLEIPESLQHLDPELFGMDTRGGVPESDDEDCEDGEDEEYDELAALDGDCYFPKDGYDYSKHLKTLSTDKKKGGVGGVILDAPKKDKDKDERKVQEALRIQEVTNDEEREVLRALEAADDYEDFDDDELEGLLPGGVVDPETVLWGPTAHEYDDMPDLATFKAMHALRIGRATEQDETCEVGSEGPHEHRDASDNANFEQFLEDEYRDEEIGAMDDDEIEGPISAENMEEILDEYLENREVEKQQLESIYEPIKGKYDDIPRVIDETKAIIQRHYENEVDEDAETTEGESEEDESKNWDCETVLSTLSNLSNRPGKITKIKIVKKPAPGKELGAIKEDAADESEEEDEGSGVVELPDVITERPRDESAEDKRARKAGVKEMRRICRRMKKESKEMYKSEATKLASTQRCSGDVRSKLRCQKL